MGIFDLFKKKKPDSTFPENELEELLMKSVTDASARKYFYQKLIWNQLFVITANNGQQEGTTVLEKDTTVQFATFEGGQIPVFTSTNRIFDKGIIKEEVSYLSLKGQDLFSIAKGATFILNPYSEYGKELVPKEIESLMNGTIYDELDEEEIQHKANEAFNKIYEEAGKKQEGLIYLDGYKSKSLGASGKERLEQSIIGFKKCLEMIPDYWQSMVLMAKSYQRLERHTEALELLEQAFKIELKNHSIPMEASLEAMHINDIEKALFYSEESIKRKPDDYALMGNHAMNLLIAEKDDEAKETIDKAIELNPKDAINKNILSIIKGVISGKRKRPTFKDSLR
ncbi:SseB family protein [Winogradskyella tangerina]|uniref:SseB family protein n=1 Tax=Winogradskyella tangerina TaxID=2023240 RepID=UPI000DBE6907|nr:SseB family protein [Winogradskyella tangerina]